jgi:hypothetical protein
MFWTIVKFNWESITVLVMHRLRSSLKRHRLRLESCKTKIKVIFAEMINAYNVGTLLSDRYTRHIRALWYIGHNRWCWSMSKDSAPTQWEIQWPE